MRRPSKDLLSNVSLGDPSHSLRMTRCAQFPYRLTALPPYRLTALPRRPSQFPASQQMQMQVVDTLSRVATGVGDETIALAV
jgi:hypothetical protein